MFTLELFFPEPKAVDPPGNAKVKLTFAALQIFKENLTNFNLHLQIFKENLTNLSLHLFCICKSSKKSHQFEFAFVFVFANLQRKSDQFVLLFNLGLCLLGRIYPAEAVEQVEEGDHHVDEDDQGEQGVRDGGHRTDRV